jgi:hypothetical protein
MQLLIILQAGMSFQSLINVCPTTYQHQASTKTLLPTHLTPALSCWPAGFLPLRLRRGPYLLRRLHSLGRWRGALHGHRLRRHRRRGRGLALRGLRPRLRGRLRRIRRGRGGCHRGHCGAGGGASGWNGLRGWRKMTGRRVILWFSFPLSPDAFEHFLKWTWLKWG